MKNQGYNPKRTGQESCALESSSKQSLFSFLRNARDMQMTTRVTEEARRERHEKKKPSFSSRAAALVSCVSRPLAFPSLPLKKKRNCSQFRQGRLTVTKTFEFRGPLNA